jgi:hypothetical protein
LCWIVNVIAGINVSHSLFCYNSQACSAVVLAYYITASKFRQVSFHGF